MRYLASSFGYQYTVEFVLFSTTLALSILFFQHPQPFNLATACGCCLFNRPSQAIIGLSSLVSPCSLFLVWKFHSKLLGISSIILEYFIPFFFLFFFSAEMIYSIKITSLHTTNWDNLILFICMIYNRSIDPQDYETAEARSKRRQISSSELGHELETISQQFMDWWDQVRQLNFALVWSAVTATFTISNILEAVR